tara:strand:- start:38 stop:433 length:396 start_codon:yes stop_codon:yes gene_type:complete
MCNSSGYLIEWAIAIRTDYKEKKISYDRAIDLLIKIGYNTINGKKFLGDNMVDINDNDTKNEIASAITFDIINTFPTKLKHIVIKLDEHKHSWELEDTILNAIENKLQQISKFNEVNNNSLDLAESIENEK